MRVLHVPFGFYPDPVGGTEVYVGSLCRELAARGVACVVAAPDRRDRTYQHEGTRVRRFGVNQQGVGVDTLYGEGDPVAAEAFERILDSERPHVVHQHALTSACSVRIARAARLRGIPVVFTYHTPTVTCHRGTLLEGGTTPCDGWLNRSRCTACTLQGLGTGRPLGRLLARVPPSAGEWIGRNGRSGGAWTAVRMSSLVDRHHQALAVFFRTIDRFVAMSPWVGDLLRANGVRSELIVNCRHGIAADRLSAEERPVRGSDRLRLAHMGRADRVKGTELLIRALRAVEGPIALDVFGIVQDAHGAAFMSALNRLAENDPRIQCCPPIPHAEVVGRLAGYDLLAAPSQWMETGPLVVLEAFAAGVPVLGSALGGIADKITDGVDGLLVRPHDSLQAWTAALQRCVRQRGLVDGLRRGVRPPRTMACVADDMLALYTELLQLRRSDLPRESVGAERG